MARTDMGTLELLVGAIQKKLTLTFENNNLVKLNKSENVCVIKCSGTAAKSRLSQIIKIYRSVLFTFIQLIFILFTNL